jgi:hypothetical protein
MLLEIAATSGMPVGGFVASKVSAGAVPMNFGTFRRFFIFTYTPTPQVKYNDNLIELHLYHRYADRDS